MTSSLPDLSSTSLAPAVSDASNLTGIATQAGQGATTDSGLSPEFATMLSAAPGSPSAVPSPANPPPAMPCASFTNTPIRMFAGRSAGCSGKISLSCSPEAGLPAGAEATLTVVAQTTPVAPAAESVAPTQPRKITREMLEEAATFVTSLLQTLLPEVKLPQFTGVNLTPAGTTPEPAGDSRGCSQLESARNILPQFTLAADGAIEIDLSLPPTQTLDLSATTTPELPVTLRAEMQVADETAVRLEVSGFVPEMNSPRSSGGLVGREKFAANKTGSKITVAKPEPRAERNFVFTGDEQDKALSPDAGITVAKTGITMPVAPIEELSSTRHSGPTPVLPLRADFQVVVPPAERITVPAAAPAGQNFAERAVDTVTSLVENQFSASLQKAGSVHLRLNFGGQDLSVRVEIREGIVHTDFRTDSPELRSALTREWQAVAAQSPEAMARYLDPIFSPHSSLAESSASAARLQQQSSQDQPSRSPRETWAEAAHPFSRRSQLSESFIPDPAVTRSPAFLPTSLRLSVLA